MNGSKFRLKSTKFQSIFVFYAKLARSKPGHASIPVWTSRYGSIIAAKVVLVRTWRDGVQVRKLPISTVWWGCPRNDVF
jgi:hypothetical protein